MASAIHVPKPSSSCPRSTLGEHLSRHNDFRKTMYSRVPVGRHGSSRSLSSFNTDDDWSRTTEPISNTVKAYEVKKQQKRRFLLFTRVLMKFLEKKNPAVCKDAQAVIQKCGEKKKEGVNGFDSLCDSLKVPLKETVGSAYWKQAKGCLEEMDDHEYEPIPLNDTRTTTEMTTSDLETLSCLLGQKRNGTGSGRGSSDPIQEEKKLRRKRFWMLIRVLMKYIQHKDPSLYAKARETIEDCARRKEQNEERFTNLPESVQRELKRVVGVGNWRRAESYLMKMLVKKAEDEACDLAFAREAMSFGPFDESNALQQDGHLSTRTNENYDLPHAAESIWSTAVGGLTKTNKCDATKRPIPDLDTTCRGNDSMEEGKRLFTIVGHEHNVDHKKRAQGDNKKRRKL